MDRSRVFLIAAAAVFIPAWLCRPAPRTGQIK